jgi:hypothetical protein
MSVRTATRNFDLQPAIATLQFPAPGSSPRLKRIPNTSGSVWRQQGGLFCGSRAGLRSRAFDLPLDCSALVVKRLSRWKLVERPGWILVPVWRRNRDVMTAVFGQFCSLFPSRCGRITSKNDTARSIGSCD